MTTDNPLTIIMIFAATLLLFWIGREIVCWYFKFSEIANHLYDIKKILQKATGQEPKKPADPEGSASI